jgi:sporulation protein YlmC with PRC-barrel domain
MKTRNSFVTALSIFGLMVTVAACENSETTVSPATPPTQAGQSSSESQTLDQADPTTSYADSERAIENDRRVEVPLPSEPSGRRATLLFSSSLVGSRVKDSKGNDVGKIKDLLLDPENRRVVYAVLSLSNREIAVPLNAVKMDPQTQTYTLEMSAENLAEAPKMSKDKKLPAELGESARQDELASSSVIREPGKAGP